MIHEIDDETFEAQIAQSDIPCVIEFTAGWCTLCKEMLPTMEALSMDFDGTVKFCTVNTDKNKQLRIAFAVAALPYIVYIADGQMSPLFDELVTKERLEERIRFMLGGGEAPTTRPLPSLR